MLKVLIVEDEDFIRKGLVYTYDWLSQNCVVAGEASDGESGLEMIQQLSPDIVITDIRMGEMDGLEMIRRGRQTHTFYSILLTGYSEFEYAKQALSLRVTEYLLKPVDEEKLTAAIQKIREEREHQPVTEGEALPQPLLDYESLQKNEKINYYVGCTLKIIEEQYAQRINIRSVADKVGVSESYLSRKFKEETGNTFVEFLNKFRIQKATTLLRHGGMRIREISELVGFEEYKRFSEVFKKYTGMSCTEFVSSIGANGKQ
ncbi:MAG: response regulator [Oscillospiraceae bacterium]|nr:response regulator [Oscillospiraceae bacterium]